MTSKEIETVIIVFAASYSPHTPQLSRWRYKW